MTAQRTWGLVGAVVGLGYPLAVLGVRVATQGTMDASGLLGDPVWWLVASLPLSVGALCVYAGTRLDAATAATAHLEQLIHHRTVALEEAAEDIRREALSLEGMLAGLSEGLFSFEPDGTLSSERSGALKGLLPKSTGMTTARQFFSHYVGLSHDVVDDVIALLWEDEDDFLSPFEYTAPMLGRCFSLQRETEEQLFTLEYKPIYGPDGALARVMVVVADVTEERATQLALEAQRERIERLSMVARDVHSYQLFVEEALSLLRKIGPAMARPPTEVLGRDLHTLKGICRMYGFAALADKLHAIEDCLLEPEEANVLFAEVCASWKDTTSEISDVLGLSAGSQWVSTEKLSQLLDRVDALQDLPLRELADSLLRFPLPAVLDRYSRLVNTVCEMTGHSALVIFDPESEEVSYEEISAVDAALVHIFTNAVTHAADADRVLRISVSSRRVAGQLTIEISDDGKGVPLERLADKAVTGGVWTETQRREASREQKLDLIFSDSLSTAETTTETAGRGVGLSAALAGLRRHGGDILVDTALGEGTRFTLQLGRNRERSAA